MQDNYFKKIVIHKTIVPETTVPPNKRGKDFLTGKSKTKAATAPVKPPNNGTGVAAKIKIAQGPYFFIFLLVFFLVCLNSHLKKTLKNLMCADKDLEIGSSKKTISIIAK